MISSLNLVFINNDLLGDQRVTDEEYSSFMKAFFNSPQKK